MVALHPSNMLVYLRDGSVGCFTSQQHASVSQRWICWLFYIPATWKCISEMDLLVPLRPSNMEVYLRDGSVGCFTSQQHASVSQRWICWLLYIPATWKCISEMDLLVALRPSNMLVYLRDGSVGCFTSQQHASVSQRWICWLLYVPATWKCISEMDLLVALHPRNMEVYLRDGSVGCFTSQQHGSVSQRWICWLLYVPAT